MFFRYHAFSGGLLAQNLGHNNMKIRFQIPYIKALKLK